MLCRRCGKNITASKDFASVPTAKALRQRNDTILMQNNTLIQLFENPEGDYSLNVIYIVQVPSFTLYFLIVFFSFIHSQKILENVPVYIRNDKLKSSLDHIHFVQTLIRLVHTRLSFYCKVARHNATKFNLFI